MSQDIILLSSDDEFEIQLPSPKRKKPDKEVLDQLNKLTGITATLKETRVIVKNTTVQETDVTIVIEGDSGGKENASSVVNLIDESFEELPIEPKQNISSDCLIVGSDSELEENPKNEKEGSVTPEIPEEHQNGNAINGVNHVVSDEINHNGINPKTEETLSRPSTSKASEINLLLEEFLECCAKSMKGSKYESRVLPKFPKLRNNFDKCENIHGEPNFKRMLQEYIETAKISAPESVVSFQRVYAYLLDHINGASIEVSEHDLLKLKKLEKACKEIMKKIKKLEAIEINFDDEEDSTYIQIDRYSRRLLKVHQKYCQLLKRNPYAGRLLHEKIQFVSSKFNEINRAITKSYKTNKFPTYYDIEKCVRKCVTKHNLDLSEDGIKEESKHCFTKMGNLLQMRRKKELYEVHCEFIALSEDPANTDESLRKQLQESLEEGSKKMKDVVEKFVKMQENNVNVDLSEDSDDSNYKSSDSGEDT